MCANRVSCFIGNNYLATARKTVKIRDIRNFENSTYWVWRVVRLAGYYS